MVKLLGRRELLAYAIVFTGCYGFIAGMISGDKFVDMVMLVLGYYFMARASEKKESETKQ